MSSQNLFRMSGLALVLAGAMFVVAELISLSVLAQGEVDEMRRIATTDSYFLQSFSTLVGGILLLGGLVGLYVRQAEAAKNLGVVGFVLAFLGTALVMGDFYANTFITPLVALEAPSFLDSPLAGVLKVWLPFDFVLLAVSWLVLCVATVRARDYPRGASWSLLGGALLALLPLPVATLVFETALAWLGLVLLKGSGPSGGGAARRGKRSRQRACRISGAAPVGARGANWPSTGRLQWVSPPGARRARVAFATPECSRWSLTDFSRIKCAIWPFRGGPGSLYSAV